jgi:hypothetical protein
MSVKHSPWARISQGKATLLFTGLTVRVYTKIRYVFHKGTVWRFVLWMKEGQAHGAAVIEVRVQMQTDGVHTGPERPVNPSQLGGYYMHRQV